MGVRGGFGGEKCMKIPYGGKTQTLTLTITLTLTLTLTLALTLTLTPYTDPPKPKIAAKIPTNTPAMMMATGDWVPRSMS